MSSKRRWGNIKSAFFQQGEASDPAYVQCRDAPNRESVRQRLDYLWRRYEPYCPDPHFLSEARHHFEQRAWEMYLAIVLLDSGLQLQRPASKGPDICIASDPQVWIEAIAVTPGEGDNAVLPASERGQTVLGCCVSTWNGEAPSEESLVLRCTSAYETKNRKRESYIRDGIVKEGDPFVVALNVSSLPDLDIATDDDDLPIPVKAVFGIGDEVVVMPWESDQLPQLGHSPRPHVDKKSGVRIDSRGFLSGQLGGVSGVFFSQRSIVDLAPLGSDISFVHNPKALNPLPGGRFPFGTELALGLKGHFQRTVWTRGDEET